ncbi:MAG: M20 metallopeptidase family protein, partial [Candidatus Hodarchaeales archaeon]
LPSGQIGIRKGVIFASSDRFTIRITGKGGHAAAPHQTIDPTSVLVDIYNALQKLIPREVSPFERTVISLPSLEASDAHNIIPNQAKIRGTLRTMNPEVREYLIERITQVVEGYCNAWRCTGSAEFDPMVYPAVINDEKTVGKVKSVLQNVGKIVKMDQTMVGEDFSYYLQKAKGVFITLGIKNKQKGVIYPHHHPRFNVDESVLWKGTAIYALLGFYPNFE